MRRIRSVFRSQMIFCLMPHRALLIKGRAVGRIGVFRLTPSHWEKRDTSTKRRYKHISHIDRRSINIQIDNMLLDSCLKLQIGMILEELMILRLSSCSYQHYAYRNDIDNPAVCKYLFEKTLAFVSTSFFSPFVFSRVLARLGSWPFCLFTLSSTANQTNNQRTTSQQSHQHHHYTLTTPTIYHHDETSSIEGKNKGEEKFVMGV